MISKADIEAMARQIRYDLSVTRTRIDELMEAVSSLPIPETSSDHSCADCAGLAFISADRLKQHRENVHGEFEEAV